MTLDWDDVRYFLATARRGSLSAAARDLAVSQPTVGRRLDAFERGLGARLFHRRSSGLELTAAGAALVEHAERMEAEALAAARRVGGRDIGPSGRVRITCSEWLAVRVVGPALAPLIAAHPALAVEVLADPRHLNLARGEADLALRPRKFEHDAIVQRRVAQLGFALYASDAYLARHGEPRCADRCAGHAMIAMNDDVGDVARPWIAQSATHARVVMRTNGREPMATMAAAGIGLACLPRVVGAATPGLRELDALPSRALWLGTHRDVRTLPRVRAVAAQLVDGFRRLQPRLA